MAKGKYQDWLTEEGLAKIERWKRHGLTNEQIAANMGICEATFYKWQEEHKEFSEAIKKGLEVIVCELENALIKRAKGYDVEEIVYLPERGGGVTERRNTKHIPPDTTVMLGQGPGARSIRLDLPKFTLVGATTRAGMLTAPLRDRFGIVSRLELYDVDDLSKIITRSAGILGVRIEPGGAEELAKRSRGTPRVANRLLRRVRDYADVRGSGVITRQITIEATNLLQIDALGLDQTDRKILETMIFKFNGRPVGLDTLAAITGEDAGTIEDMYEPYLLQQALIARTPKGRIPTPMAWEHLGLTPPEEMQKQTIQEQRTLFDDLDGGND